MNKVEKNKLDMIEKTFTDANWISSEQDPQLPDLKRVCDCSDFELLQIILKRAKIEQHMEGTEKETSVFLLKNQVSFFFDKNDSLFEVLNWIPDTIEHKIS